MRPAIILAIALSFACGCQQRRDAPGASSTTANPSSAAPVSAKASASASADDPLASEAIPVAEDYEDEAEKAIDDDNLDEELGKLEKEVANDK